MAGMVWPVLSLSVSMVSVLNGPTLSTAVARLSAIYINVDTSGLTVKAEDDRGSAGLRHPPTHGPSRTPRIRTGFASFHVARRRTFSPYK